MNEPTIRTALLSLGSNLGERETSIMRAIELIKEITQADNFRLSRLIETDPVGYEDQPAFLNCALAFDTSLDPVELLDICKRIEERLGRMERPRWHEREIDIDIILLGNLVLNTEKCTIPHPRMQERLFVLLPAAEIAPDMIHPILNKTVKELLDALTNG
jgi:2-amino-4-hydroxy-6-hydroxymethyldihydropteridine diphosphokinase